MDEEHLFEIGDCLGQPSYLHEEVEVGSVEGHVRGGQSARHQLVAEVLPVRNRNQSVDRERQYQHREYYREDSTHDRSDRIFTFYF